MTICTNSTDENDQIQYLERKKWKGAFTILQYYVPHISSDSWR